MAYEVLISYLLIVNLAAFLVMGADKRRARENRRRVPEKRLFTLGAVGGALGIWLGMRLWRHKTKHRSFTVGVPLLLLLNIAAVVVLTQIMAY